MNHNEINEYVKAMTGEPLEIMSENDTMYVKFDFLPYPLREFIHSQPDYDHSKMAPMVRECQCGQAYFLEALHFYNLTSRFSI